MFLMFVSETLLFVGLFVSAQCLTLSAVYSPAVVNISMGAQTITLVLGLMGQVLGVASTHHGQHSQKAWNAGWRMQPFFFIVLLVLVLLKVYEYEFSMQAYYGVTYDEMLGVVCGLFGMFELVQVGHYYHFLTFLDFYLSRMHDLTATVSHKFVAAFYWTAGVIGLMWAFVNSLMQRLELAEPGQRIFLNTDQYNVYITGHGLLMIFGFAMPLLFGAFGNLLVPMLVCSPEVGYAKLNNFSYVIYVSSLLILLQAHLMDVMTGLGWTLYPPLSTSGTLLAAYGITIAVLGLIVMGFSTTLSSMNFVATVTLRSSSIVGTVLVAGLASTYSACCTNPLQGVVLVLWLASEWIVGLFLFLLFAARGALMLIRNVLWVWVNTTYLWSLPMSGIGTTAHSFITTSVLLLLVLPILGLALMMLISDTYFNTCYFSNDVAGGDVVLYRHLFWFFGHPEVYVLILPGFGLASLIFCLHTGNLVYGEQIQILGVWCIAVLGTFVWAHHQYTTSLETDTRAFYTIMTQMIAVPTGTKIYNYTVTLHRYVDTMSTAKTSAYTFILVIFVMLFSFGGATGVILGNAQVDITLHDCYYVVAHFHYVH
jgi:cytochrome c oxidase subunit 1